MPASMYMTRLKFSSCYLSRQQQYIQQHVTKSAIRPIHFSQSSNYQCVITNAVNAKHDVLEHTWFRSALINTPSASFSTTIKKLKDDSSDKYKWLDEKFKKPEV